MSALAVLLAFVGLACEAVPLDPTGTGEDPSESVSLVVEPESADVSVGDTVQLEARVVTDEGQEVSGVDFAWSVSDPEVASVDDAGELVGLAQGNVDVTVEATLSSGGDQSLTGGASVAVLPRTAASVSISPSSPSVELGDTLQLMAAVTDENGEPVEQSVEWASSDTQVASVDADGTLVGHAEGEASISARASSVADTAGVSVELTPAASVEVSPSSVTLGEGETTQLEATVQDESGNELDRSVSWSSSNTSVATVDPLGQVQAQVEGEATITARSGEAESTAQVVVEAGSSAVPEMPTSLSVSESSRTDTSVEYEADWSGSSGASSYSWSAGSNGGNWSDSGSGVTGTDLTFTAPRGDADDGSYFCVSAVNSSGSSENRCTSFTVPAQSGGGGGDPASDSVATITVSPSSASLSSLGVTRQFSAEARNETGDVLSGVGFSWSSSTPSVATVDASGLATAQAEGQAQIIASAQGVQGSATVTVDTTSSGGGGDGTNPNEPSGMTTWTDRQFSVIDGDGWNDEDADSDWSIVTDDLSPTGSSSVGRIRFPAGFSDGNDPARSTFGEFSSSEIYLHFWIKLSSNWEHHPVADKIFYITDGSYSGGGDPVYLAFTGNEFEVRIQGGGDGSLSGTPNLGENVGSVGIQTGRWHSIEVHLVQNTGSSFDGEAHVWIDGVKTIQYTDVQYQTGGDYTFDSLRWEPIWGGLANESVDSTMYMSMARIYLSGR